MAIIKEIIALPLTILFFETLILLNDYIKILNTDNNTRKLPSHIMKGSTESYRFRRLWLSPLKPLLIFMQPFLKKGCMNISCRYARF